MKNKKITVFEKYFCQLTVAMKTTSSKYNQMSYQIVPQDKHHSLSLTG